MQIEITNFDFFEGTWDVTNRRLRERNVGCSEWEQFPGVSVARRFFGGHGNFDEITFPTKSFSGATVRLFDQQARRRTDVGDQLDHGFREAPRRPDRRGR